MSNLSLYEITGNFRELQEKLSDMSLDAQTIADTLEASDEQTALEVKMQGYEMIARNFEAGKSVIQAEIERLQQLAHSRQARADALRKRMLDAMVATGIEKISCPLFQISRRANPAKVVVYEPGLIASEFMRQSEPPAPTVDKVALKKALQAGQEVQGARLERSERIVIS